jgi:multidrug efflux system membrane fusion protein
VLVVGGLAGGETVVTAGVHMLHAGQKVLLAQEPASSVAKAAKP